MSLCILLRWASTPKLPHKCLSFWLVYLLPWWSLSFRQSASSFSKPKSILMPIQLHFGLMHPIWDGFSSHITFYLEIIVASHAVVRNHRQISSTLHPVSSNNNILHNYNTLSQPGNWHWHIHHLYSESPVLDVLIWVFSSVQCLSRV